MIPFRVSFEPGAPIHEQIVYAAKKAIVAGQLAPGDGFPSVRALSRELRINPNTAHKAINQLVSEGLLEVHPGLGTLVALRPAAAQGRSQLLSREIEQLVVEALRLGVGLDELTAQVERQWRKVGGWEPAAARRKV